MGPQATMEKQTTVDEKYVLSEKEEDEEITSTSNNATSSMNEGEESTEVGNAGENPEDKEEVNVKDIAELEKSANPKKMEKPKEKVVNKMTTEKTNAMKASVE